MSTVRYDLNYDHKFQVDRFLRIFKCLCAEVLSGEARKFDKKTTEQCGRWMKLNQYRYLKCLVHQQQWKRQLPAACKCYGEWNWCKMVRYSTQSNSQAVPSCYGSMKIEHCWALSMRSDRKYWTNINSLKSATSCKLVTLCDTRSCRTPLHLKKTSKKQTHLTFVPIISARVRRISSALLNK